MSHPCEGRKRTRFTQNMNACRATANSVHTSPYRGLNRCYRGLNEAQLRSKRGATAVQTRFKRGATAVNASDERGSASFKTQTHYTLSLVCTVHVHKVWTFAFRTSIYASFGMRETIYNVHVHVHVWLLVSYIFFYQEYLCFYQIIVGIFNTFLSHGAVLCVYVCV